ncbi:hypothetical protein ACGFS9_10255 [Streptomyces sp. NPDC048566]|uniref:hypothetical protein n=1 Tax=Streptomyces sp. NPDC048566 TaxID=3365569 RepID=UPI00370FE0CA
MTPWLRTLPTAGLLVAALLGGACSGAGAAPPPRGTLTGLAGRAGPAVPEPERAVPTPDASRAGSLPGEGRTRPGRADEDASNPAESDPGADPGTDIGTDIGAGLTQVGDAPRTSRDDAAPVQQNVVGPEQETRPVLQVLPLGGGLILLGLGLGLAFLGLRLRRG